jgi:hypothetical protein
MIKNQGKVIELCINSLMIVIILTYIFMIHDASFAADKDIPIVYSFYNIEDITNK